MSLPTSAPGELSGQQRMVDQVTHTERFVAGAGLLLGGASSWFLAITALVYGTGFLIVVTFLDGWGLRETGAEFLKAKYTHVGILCLSFPAIFGGTLIGFGEYYRRKRKPEAAAQLPSGIATMPHVFVPVVALLMNLTLIFYIYVMFAPPKFHRDNPGRIALVFLVTIPGLVALRFWDSVARRMFRKKWVAPAQAWGRWVLMAVVIGVLDVYSLWNKDLCETLGDVLRAGGWTFIVFVVLLMFVLWRLLLLDDDLPQPLRRPLWVAGFCVVGAIYYLSVMSFTHSFFPCIRATRGGGDYSGVEPVRIYVRPDRQGRAGLPEELFEARGSDGNAGQEAVARSSGMGPNVAGGGGFGACATKPVIVIDESVAGYFVADPTEARGPKMWRFGRKPRVFWVARDLVGATVPVGDASRAGD